MWLAIGVVVGAALFVVAVFFFGHSRYEQLMKNDRVITKRPIPEPFPKDMVVVTYKRRHHHRHHSVGQEKMAGKLIVAVLFAIALTSGLFYLVQVMLAYGDAPTRYH